MVDDLVSNGRLVTVFGGSGFVGRHVVRALAVRGWRVRVATRRPELAFHLQTNGRVGQIYAVQANLRYPASVANALRGADAVVNLVGLLAERGAQSFEATHVEGARFVADAAKAARIERVVHMSALGADPDSSVPYAHSKAMGEAAVLELRPQAVIMRPSVIFGPEDSFFNRFATIAQMSPALPLIGGGKALMQPVFVGDVAEAIARAIDGQATPGAIYELGGPQIKSFRDLMAFVLDVTERRRLLAPLPFPVANVVAQITEIAKAASFGLFPDTFMLTRGQVALLKHDNVVSAAAQSSDRTLHGLGISPESYESIVPTYLYRFRKTGQFAPRRLT
jgi:uncharacterized protein YbjT (DUF2867 family)